MARIVHISDLHFGTVAPEMVDPLLDLIHSLDPRVVVISGDLTQRAREWQFAEARQFLNRIAQPKIVVPGNHDIPFWNVWDRFRKPLDLYKKYVSMELEPEYQDDELFILSVNTARSLVWKGGRISYDQIQRLKHRLRSARPGLMKAIVMHHPIIPLERAPGLGVVGRAQKALEVIQRAGVALLMAGHGHHDYIAKSTTQFGSALSSILVVHAGTALSRRTRGAPNSFNVLEISDGSIEQISCVWDSRSSDFVPRRRNAFKGLGLTPISPNATSPEQTGKPGVSRVVDESS